MATEEQASLRAFKDSLMRHAATLVDATLFEEGEQHLREAAARVEDAYARVREYLPEELSESDPRFSYEEIFAALQKRGKEREKALPPRRVLVHVLAELDYYFFKQTLGYGRMYNAPHLTDEERTAEHALRHDLLIALYKQLEPAFEVSLSWPQR